jgi:Fe-S cluster assembly protein SufD
MSNTATPHLADSWSRALKSADTMANPGWMQTIRETAAGQIRTNGLPDRKVEAWRYTPMRLLEKLDLQLGADADAFEEGAFPPEITAADTVVHILNGVLQGVPETPAGFTVMTLADAMRSHEDRIKRLLEATDLVGRDRVFTALNTAFLDQALVIHLGAAVDAGSLLLRWAFSGSRAAKLGNFRIFLLMDEGARLEMIEQFESEVETDNALNIVTHIELGEQAALEHVRVQHEGEASVILTSTAVGQAAHSLYTYSGFDFGGGLVRHEIHADLLGKGARSEIRGAFVLDGKRYADHHVSVDHRSGGCSSEQFFRGVLGGYSRGVFNGRALIREGADGSVVHQSNANLLLSEFAEIDTKPELEIYADEVEASHGATVGQLDEAAVFYLRTRGLGDDQARRILTAAFCHAVTDRLQNKVLAERLASLLDAAMPGGPPLIEGGD